jgi:hypothetical protein
VTTVTNLKAQTAAHLAKPNSRIGNHLFWGLLQCRLVCLEEREREILIKSGSQLEAVRTSTSVIPVQLLFRVRRILGPSSGPGESTSFHMIPGGAGRGAVPGGRQSRRAWRTAAAGSGGFCLALPRSESSDSDSEPRRRGLPVTIDWMKNHDQTVTLEQWKPYVVLTETMP